MYISFVTEYSNISSKGFLTIGTHVRFHRMTSALKLSSMYRMNELASPCDTKAIGN